MLRISARRARNFGSALAGLCLAATLPLAAQAQTTLERIKQRGHLICGTSQGVAGFSLPDAQGQWRGFDTDLCRALAAAIFNDQEKAKYISLASKDRLTVLQSGEIDVLSRTTTWTLGRDAGWLLTSHLPTGLRDDSAIAFAAATARGAADALWPWAGSAVWVPLLWFAAGAVAAWLRFARRRVD